MLKIFLAHAKEDKEIVTALYYRLKKKGYEPWLDKENLLPGQFWRAEIPKAIRNSQVFIACLSNRSVEKQGYVQDEFKMALKTCASKPTGSVYLIPIRLDECVIPELRQEEYGLTLRDIQWLDFFEEDGFDRLVKALEYAEKVKPVENASGTPINDPSGTSSPPIPPFPKKKANSGDNSQEDSPANDLRDSNAPPIPPFPEEEVDSDGELQKDNLPAKDGTDVDSPIGFDLGTLLSGVDRSIAAMISFIFLIGLVIALLLAYRGRKPVSPVEENANIEGTENPPIENTPNLTALKNFSSGERLLMSNSICEKVREEARSRCVNSLEEANRASSAFKEADSSNDYSNAISLFGSAINEYQNNPELHIYINNALVRQAEANGFDGRKITLAAAVPAGSEPGSDTVGRAGEMLRGIADAQSCYIGSQKYGQLDSNLDYFKNLTPLNCPPNSDGLLLEIVVVDDKNEPDKAKEDAKAIVREEDISGVIGHYASSVTDSALAVYNSNGTAGTFKPIPVISPASTKYDLNSSENFYRTTASTEKQGSKIADYLRRQNVEAVLGIYDSKDEYSTALWGSFDRAFTEDNKQVGTTVINPSDSATIVSELEEEFRKQLEEQILGGQKFAVFIAPPSTFKNGTLSTESQKWELITRISEAIREKDPSGQNSFLIGGNDLYAPESIGFGSGLYGMVFTVSWFSEYYKDAIEGSYAAKSENKWGGRISWATANSYDATHVFMQAFANINSEDNEIRRELIKRIPEVELEREYSSGEGFVFEDKEPDREPFMLEILAEESADESKEYAIRVVDDFR